MSTVDFIAPKTGIWVVTLVDVGLVDVFPPVSSINSDLKPVRAHRILRALTALSLIIFKREEAIRA